MPLNHVHAITIIRRLNLVGQAMCDCKTRSPHWFVVIFLCLCIFSLSLGCTPGIINKSVSQHQQLGFLLIGKTTEQETIARMGESLYRYEGGKIWIYWLLEDTRHRLYFPNESYKLEEGLSWAPGTYYLVLVFDENRILTKHSLLYYSPRPGSYH